MVFSVSVAAAVEAVDSVIFEGSQHFAVAAEAELLIVVGC